MDIYTAEGADQLQTAISGKSKEETDELIKNGAISFDAEKYRLVPCETTTSGYRADFTDEYLKEICDASGMPDISFQACRKIDKAISAGAFLDDILEPRMYMTHMDIELIRPRQMRILIFRFISGRKTEIVMDTNGRFFKGSLKMNQHREIHRILKAGNEKGEEFEALLKAEKEKDIF